MTTIVVFFSSLFMTSALVLLKAIELKREKKNFFLKIINRFDSGSNKLVNSLKFKSLQLIQIIRYIILVESKRIIEGLLSRAQEKILSEYKKRQDLIIAGKKEIMNKGSVSFYLKKIKEDKGNGQRGKIEEVL